MSAEGLFWRQTESGRWERNLDEVEQFYTTLARRFVGIGRTHFAMTCHVSLYILRDNEMVEPRLIDALQKAWVYLRFDHPTIASWVEYNPRAERCRKVYKEFPGAGFGQAAKEWLDETFHLVTSSRSGDEWRNSKPSVSKLPTLLVIKQTTTPDHTLIFDLVFRSQHDIIDGMGSFQLMGNLIRYAAQLFIDPTTFVLPNFGAEIINLSPPLRVAAEIPENLTVQQKARFKRIVEQNAMLCKKAEISSIPFRFGRSVPGSHQRVEFNITPEVSSGILLACKAIKASVTQVYHASIAMAMRDIQERRSKRRKIRYISYSLINERGRCKNSYPIAHHAAAVYHSVSGQSMTIDLEVPDTTSKPLSDSEIRDEMLGVVDQVKQHYLSIKNDHEHLSMTPSYWKLATPDYPIGKDSEDPPIPPPNPTPSVSISSLGVIDNLIPSQHGPFELDNPWVTGEELGTGIGLMIGTFRGRMSVSAVYNDAWHDKAEVRNFVEKCHMLVLNCLMIYRG